MKNEININWDCDDAEGKNYCLYDESNYSCRFYKTKPIIESEGFWTHSKNYLGDPLADKWTLHERPKEKQMDSIYTQEMFDKGEECEVGMMFQDSSGCKYMKLLESDVEGFTVIKNRNQEYSLFCQSGIKPIDTRTDKQKAIDDLVSELTRTNFDANMNDMDLTSIVNVAFDAGVTFTENKND